MNQNPKMIVNFTKFFAGEPRDVYLQNLSDKQLSLQFELPGGAVESFLVPAVKDPINLSQHIPWQAIVNSTDLRRMSTKRPAILNLMNEDQYREYYANKAKRYEILTDDGKPDIEKAIEVAETKANLIRNHQPLPDAPDPKPIHDVVRDADGKQVAKPFEMAASEEICRPKILHLVNQVGNPKLEDKDRMPVKAFLEEVENLPNLTVDELEYILAHGYYKTVKKWAKAEMEKAVAAGASEGAEG